MHQEIIKKIQSMNENDFTKKIIIPLFKNLNYNAKFNGGVYEKGKDAICWKFDEFDEIEFTVIQSKMKKLDAKSSGNNSMSTVLNQMIEATNNLIEHTDGQKYKPKTVYFVSPQDIDEKALQQRFNDISTIKHQIKFLDLSKLIKAFDKYSMWEHIYKLFEKDIKNINNILSKEIENKELYNALAYFKDINKGVYYSDLDITYLNSLLVIQVTNQISLNSNESYFILDNNEYIDFKKFVSSLLTELPNLKEFINFEKIENIHNLSNEELNIEKIKNFRIELKILEKLFRDIDEINQEYNLIKDSLFRKIIDDSMIFILELNIEELKGINNYSSYIKLKKQNEIRKLKDLLNKIEDKYNNEVTLLKELIPLLIKFINKYYELLELKKNLILITDYYFIINIEKLKKYLNKILISINNKVLKNNTFIEGIKEILEFKNKIYNLEVYLKELSFIFIKSKNTKNQKIEHHVKTILDEGINVVIEANAGAGKTTTLQHYSKFGNKSSIKVFIPLTKVINLIYKIEELNSYEKKKNAFLNAICTYFSSQSELVTFNMNNLIDLFNNKNSIFLFDGYDEISNIAPWIINIIEELIEKYKVIIAISSRPEYIKDLRKDFLFVKLLDFKKEQRDKFIDSWLINKPQIAKKLKEHIYEYKIEGLLNNPLSATIFCRLAEQDYPLPITEAEMYHYRLDLLLGEYDKHKQITRNQIPKYTLEKIVIKIGFIFHKHNKRSMSKDEILFYLEIEYKYKDKKELECILEELISPCNILFDEFNDSKYTFGHLRYQEYLVAKEFQNNRGREIELYITNSWWRGALILFSQLTDNINYLIEELIEKVIEEDIEIINKYFEVIKEMIEVRPDSKEKEALYKLLNYYKIDNYKESFRKIIKS